MLIPSFQHQSNTHKISDLRPLRHCNTPKCLTPASVMVLYNQAKVCQVWASCGQIAQPIICNILILSKCKVLRLTNCWEIASTSFSNSDVLPSRLQHCGGSCCPLGPVTVHQPQGLHRLQQTRSTILWLFQETFD